MSTNPFISSNVPHDPIDVLWRDYLSAREAAERSRDIHCGIAAGQAWRNWLSAFVAEPGADDLAEVVPHGNG